MRQISLWVTEAFSTRWGSSLKIDPCEDFTTRCILLVLMFSVTSEKFKLVQKAALISTLVSMSCSRRSSNWSLIWFDSYRLPHPASSPFLPPHASSIAVLPASLRSMWFSNQLSRCNALQQCAHSCECVQAGGNISCLTCKNQGFAPMMNHETWRGFFSAYKSSTKARVFSKALLTHALTSVTLVG